jgi:ABC-type nitrate/sulfonate/bicarbonate transport system substrate-binding protein
MAKGSRSAAAATMLGGVTVGAGWLAVMLSATPGAAVASDKIVLQLHREPQFEFAGYYTALWKGFYREAGLQVEIKLGAAPGAPPIDPVREVTERRAQFGTGDGQLLIRAAQGLPLLLLAPIFQQSGTTVYYRGDVGISSLPALLNARIGRLPPSNILDVELRTALHGAGIDAEKLKSVPVEPGRAVTALAERRVDAVVGSAWELPWQARERSVALKSFSFAGSGPEFYGDGLFTLQRFANSDPDTAQRFREASIKGWEYALQHSDEIAARMVAELPVAVPVSDAAGFARYQSEVARKLARFSEVPLGHSNPQRWSEIQESMVAIGAIPRPADLEAFLYDPGAPAWGFMRDLALLALAAAGVFALFAAGSRFWRRRSGLRLFTLVRPLFARFRAMAHDGFERVCQITRRLAMSTAGGRQGPRAIDPIGTDLNLVLQALESSIRRQVPRRIRCRLSLLPECCVCQADPDRVSAMARDLVASAAADMPRGGELVVGTRHCTIDRATAAEFPGSAPGDYVRVTVKDNGCGLSPQDLENIFFPETTVRPAIAACWELTRTLGGFASVESAEGVGTAVHLYFVRVSRPEDDTGSPAGLDDVHALAAE